MNTYLHDMNVFMRFYLFNRLPTILIDGLTIAH